VVFCIPVYLSVLSAASYICLWFFYDLSLMDVYGSLISCVLYMSMGVGVCLQSVYEKSEYFCHLIAVQVGGIGSPDHSSYESSALTAEPLPPAK
jgi:hypothetical protein